MWKCGNERMRELEDERIEEVREGVAGTGHPRHQGRKLERIGTSAPTGTRILLTGFLLTC